jgi:acetolactate decarboxylase
MTPLLRAFGFLALIGSIAPAPDDSGRHWNGQIHYWGTMYEALGQGKTQARVTIREAAASPHTVAVGALSGLTGEITIIDGKAWIAQDASSAVAGDPAASSHSATLLVSATVPAWQTVALETPISPDNLESTIQSIARKSGIDTSKPFPFVIEGVVDAEAHVVRGQCPHAAAIGAETSLPPDRFSVSDNNATLVGFFAESGAGTITHHGGLTHVHIVVPGAPPLSGHVDSVTVRSSAALRLPAVSD